MLLIPTILRGVEGSYVGVLGGVNLLQNEHRHEESIKYKTGYTAGVVAGHGFCNNFRLETEFLYRRNNVKRVENASGKFHCGHYRSYSLMANCLYDFDICYPVTPYLGVGVGADRETLSVSLPEGSFREHKTRFAAQGIVGFSYPICDFTEMSIDYRYHWVSNHCDNNTFTLGLKYIF